jgi:hypothetical protein
MSDSASLLLDVAFLIVASLPVAILTFLWGISALYPSPRWVYVGSKWSTIVLLLPWLLVSARVVSDIITG